MRGYAPAGQTPVLTMSARWTSISIISAITQKGLVRFAFREGAISSAPAPGRSPSFGPTSSGGVATLNCQRALPRERCYPYPVRQGRLTMTVFRIHCGRTDEF